MKNSFSLPLKAMKLSNADDDEDMGLSQDEGASYSSSPTESPLTSPRPSRRNNRSPQNDLRKEFSLNRSHVSPNVSKTSPKTKVLNHSPIKSSANKSSKSPNGNITNENRKKKSNELDKFSKNSWVENASSEEDDSNMLDANVEQFNSNSEQNNLLNIPILKLSGLSSLSIDNKRNDIKNGMPLSDSSFESIQTDSARNYESQNESSLYDTDQSARNNQEANLSIPPFNLNLPKDDLESSQKQMRSTKLKHPPTNRNKNYLSSDSQEINSDVTMTDDSIESTQSYPIDYIIPFLTNTNNNSIEDVKSKVSHIWFQSQDSNPDLFDVVPYFDSNNVQRFAVAGNHPSTLVTLNDYMRIAKEREIFKRRAELCESALYEIQSQNDILIHEMEQEKLRNDQICSENEFLRQKLSHYEKLRAEMLSTVENLKQQHGMLIEAIVTSHSKSPSSPHSARNVIKSKSPLPKSPSGSQSARM